MLSIITTKTREVQSRRPRGPLVINYGSWQAKDLVLWYPAHSFTLGSGNGWKNALNTRFALTNTNAATIGIDQEMGRVFKLNSASTQYFIQTGTSPITAAPLTIAAWCLRPVTSSGSAGTIATLQSSTSASATRDAFILLAQDEGTTPDNIVSAGTCDADSYDSSVSDTGYRIGEWFHAVGVFPSVTDRYTVLNGVRGTSNTTSSTPAGIDRICIGVRMGSGAANALFNGNISDVRFYKRALSDAEVYALYDIKTRWDLYYPIGRVSYFFNAGTQAYNFDVSPGTYALTGANSLTQATRLLDASPGSYALTGFDALLAKGYAFDVASGTYALTGANANLIVARVLDTSPGTYAITGSDAALVAGRILNTDAGGYVITGSDALLVAGRCVEAGAGTYILTGADAGVIAARILDTTPGAYVITGFNADLVWTPLGANHYAFDVSPGVYALTGADSLLLAARFLDVSQGSYALSGTDVALIAARVMDVLPGSYLISGSDSLLVFGRTLDVAPGSYSITGADATTITDRILAALPGSYLITGYNADLISSGAAAINDGDEVQVIITGGIECSVFHDTGTDVRVVISSVKQISVLTEGGTPIKVKI